jgi:hypothetical protein
MQIFILTLILAINVFDFYLRHTSRGNGLRPPTLDQDESYLNE